MSPEEANQLPLWSCELSKVNPESESFTVGTKHLLQCQGEYIEKFNQSPEIKFADEKAKYALKILKSEVNDHTTSSYVVTAYKPGDFKNTPFSITDGFTGFKVQGLSWKVNSVIEKGVKQEPYGPMGPFQLTMPWWFWGSLILIFATIAAVIFRKVRKYQVRKALLEELEAHTTALSPFNQFSKDMRKILRKFEGKKGAEKTSDYFAQVDEAFRLYLIRELKVPALDWKPRDIMGEIKLRHKKVYMETGRDIRKVLLEFEKAKKVVEKISPVDCEQLASMSRQVADQVYRISRKKLQ